MYHAQKAEVGWKPHVDQETTETTQTTETTETTETRSGDDGETGPAPPSKGKEYTDANLGDGAFDEGYRIQVSASYHYFFKQPGESEFEKSSLKKARAMMRQPGGDAAALVVKGDVGADGDSGVVRELKGLLGEKRILLYGDSITEELGELYLKHQGVACEYVLGVKHKEMRGAKIEHINSQVSTRANVLKEDVKPKLRGAGLVVVSAGKNDMTHTSPEGIAAEVRARVLMPVLKAKPRELPMLYVTPTKLANCGEADTIAECLHDLETEYPSFKIVGRADVNLAASDFRSGDPLHLSPTGRSKLARSILAKANQARAPPKPPKQTAGAGSSASLDSTLAELPAAWSIRDRLVAAQAAAEREGAALAAAEKRRDEARTAAEAAARTRKGTTDAKREVQEVLRTTEKRDQAADQALGDSEDAVKSCEQAVAGQKRKVDHALLEKAKWTKARKQEISGEIDRLERQKATLAAELAALS